MSKYKLTFTFDLEGDSVPKIFQSMIEDLEDMKQHYEKHPPETPEKGWTLHIKSEITP